MGIIVNAHAGSIINNYDIHDNEVVNVGINGEVQETSEIHRDEDTEEDDFPAVQRDADCSEGLNYEALRAAMKEFLTEEWLEELRSDERYTVGWMNAFVDALISSPHGEKIAREWSVEGREKKNKIMGYVLGLLADERVLKGSNDSISKSVDLMEKPRTFAKYMGEGKKQPYALWVKEYVSANVGK